MKNFSTLVAALLLSLTGLFAQQQVFVLYDANCMLRVKYEQAIAQQPQMDYFAYQLSLANGNKLILETGVEGNVRQNYLPPNYLTCTDPRLNADFADQINGNRTKVFMLVPEGNDYLIQPVTMGAVLAKQGNLLTYVSPLASFQFDTRNVIIGENLAFNNNNARVFFEGRDDDLCGGTYLIRQLMPRNAYPVIDYKINPELGVIERRLGSDGNTAVGGVTVARTVNNTPVANYLAVNCNNTATNANPAYATNAPATYGPGVVVPPSGYVPPVSNPTPGTINPVAPPSTSIQQSAPLHSVAKGETLYGISRRYDVSVNELKEWNNLPSNTINVGQELRVGSPGITPTNASNQLMVSRGPVANSNVGAAQPTPYGNTAPIPGQPTGLSPADQQHIVQPGETVASVALKYGYTEAKFREINGLGANEYLRIGQRLKISDCNCPEATQQATGTSVQAAPSTYGSGVVVPQPFGTTSTTPVGGTPVGPTATMTPNNNFRQPAASNQSQTNPPAYGSPAPSQYNNVVQPGSNQKSPASSVNITNDPGFGSAQPNVGQVIPNVYQSPATSGQSMNSLEGNTPVIGNNPSTYGNQIYNNYANDVNSTSGNTRAVHVVQQGESLNAIAQRYGLTVDQLRSLNNLSRVDIIIPFQRLYIN